VSAGPSRVLVTGAEGQLGQALLSCLGDRVVWSGGRAGLDVTDGDRVRERLRAMRPDVVVNASAYNKVDAAEASAEAAFLVNAVGPLNLARACAESGVPLVHVSTDYVFDGTKGSPYTEDDAPRPRSVYGLTKRAGELAVQSVGGPCLVVRTSGVLGAGGSRGKGGSFVERILQRARAAEPLRVVDDQVFAPTFAGDLAMAIVGLLDTGSRGLVHVTNDGACSWHELAVAALGLAGIEAPVERISAASLGAPAPRPAYSVLDTSLYRSRGLPPLRPWRDALAELVAALRV
jgi:dTDP-4-dehydrorhamnose reductase